MKVKIQKLVPIPKTGRTGGTPRRWPWFEMQPGDSFFAPGYVSAGGDAKPGELKLSAAYAKAKMPGSEWTMRTRDEGGVRGVRVWRVK